MTDKTKAKAPKAPEDVPEDRATGYAVYDTQLQRYVTGVYGLDAKPTDDAARKLAPNGHRVVRV